LKHKTLALGIVLLFIVSSVIPMTLGQGVETANVDVELERMLDNLRFMCTTPDGFSEDKYEYYKEQLLRQYSSEGSNDDMIVEPGIENDDLAAPVKPLSSPVFSGGPMDSAWPMKCFNTHHTSQSPYSTASTTSAEKWRFYQSGWVDETPVIGNDGIIYFGGAYEHLDWYLYAIYPDGTEKWKFKTGGLILGSSPAIADDGTIYIGAWDNFLYAINSDGTEKWKFPANNANIASSPVIAEDGTIYFGDLGDFWDNSRIYAVDPDGTEKWNYVAGNRIYSDPCIGNDGTIYIGSDDTYLYAMNPDGTLKWRFKTGSYIKAPPSIADDGTIYIGSWDDYLYAIYPDGTEKWRHGIGSGTSVNPSIASDGTIYSESSNKLFAVYPDGTRKWTFDLGPDRHIDSSSAAISADGTIYVGTNIGNMDGGEIIAINPDGTERWRKRIANDWVESSPSIAEDGTVYIGCAYAMSEGYLHAFGNPTSNEPPSIPTITGPTNGNAGVSHVYTFVSSDPENYPVKYYVEWDDDTSTGWTGEYESGEEVTISHTWSEQGTYEIRAKAIDISNAESDWGTLEVTMPVNQHSYSFPLFQRLLERFPNAFPIMRHLFDLE